MHRLCVDSFYTQAHYYMVTALWSSDLTPNLLTNKLTMGSAQGLLKTSACDG